MVWAKTSLEYGRLPISSFFKTTFPKGVVMNYIMNGADLHDNTIVATIAQNAEAPVARTYENTRKGRDGMVRDMKKIGEGLEDVRFVVAYEASSQGFGLYDDLVDAGVECYVLAPTKIARSIRQKYSKNDDLDAQHILELLRGHLMAGNALPAIWVPDKQTRDDREIVRARLDAAEKLTAVKTQVQTLLKRNGIRQPFEAGRRTKKYRAWLKGLTAGATPLRFGARHTLASLMRQLEFLESEIETLNGLVETLSQDARWAEGVDELIKIPGVGILIAMVFLTEIGDMSRFKNRKQVGSYLGLTPSCHESGESGDRKGHITHQGPQRLRKMLNQAIWSRVRCDRKEKTRFDEQVERNPKHKKIAVVAAMRRLGVTMWHRGLEAQQRSQAFEQMQPSMSLS
jgi:transposase